MKSLNRIAIITGGTNSERQVSLWSAINVANILEAHFAIEVFDFPKQRDEFVVRKNEFDVAIPIYHGPGGEDGTLQGFLKTLGVPFIFSDVGAHALAMNKHAAKEVVKTVGLNVPDGKVLEINQTLKYKTPVVVKPLAGGSTIGISIATSQNKLDQAIKAALEFDERILVEKLIKGREFAVTVIDEGGKTESLPIIEIISNEGFFDFDSKYIDGKMANEICPAKIEDELTKQLQQDAINAHNALGCRHLSRTDFIVDDSGKNWYLETNTIPGMTKNSLTPKSIRAANKGFIELFNDWINDALANKTR